MKYIIETLEQKRKQLKQDYQSHLETIQHMVNDPINVKSITFEQNMITHLIEMNSLKNRLNEITDQIIYLTIETED